VVAFAPDCPHEGTSLTHGTFEEGLLRCRTHRYLYDPVTGANIEPARTDPGHLDRLCPGHLRTHAVRELGGWIWVAVEPGPRPGPGEGEAAEASAPGPPPPREDEVPAITTDVAGEAEVRLPPPPGRGLVWVVEAAGPEVEVVGQELHAGDGSLVVRLEGRSLGTTELTCRLRRPWEDHDAEVRRIPVEVVVPTAEPGGSAPR